jgi:lysozyme family protein
MEGRELFDKCIVVILQNEGGYVNNLSDPGGETQWGIAKKFYPGLDIKSLTKEQAIEIYFKDYWTPMNLDPINSDTLKLQLFDMGVNAGIRAAIRIIQRLVFAKPDGIIGPHTVELINAYNQSVNLTELYKHERKRYYLGLTIRKPELKVFLKGWIARVEKTKL